MNNPLIETTSQKQFIDTAVEILVKKISMSIEDHGFCTLGLSGGSTPRPIYEALGQKKLPWEHIIIFLVDERDVEADSMSSNQKLVRDTLLLSAAIPEENICFPDCSLPLDECVKKYEADLEQILQDEPADVVVLGLGEDGHIASLFPPLSHDVLSSSKTVFHTETDAFDIHDRITVSLDLIAAAHSQVFFLQGEGKKKAWTAMQGSNEEEGRWPAKYVLEKGDDVTVVTLW